jgi:hypothetical protein
MVNVVSRVAAALAFAVLALPAQSAAQTRQVTLTGVNGVYAHSVYIGPYYLSTPGLPTLDVICDDYLNGVHVGDTWRANFTNVASGVLGGTQLGQTRWGQTFGAAAPSMYLRAIWLSRQFYSAPRAEWAGIHAAIWNTFTPGAPAWTEGAAWLARANAAQAEPGFIGDDLQYWYVVTDVNTASGAGGRQEYLTYVTPEPGTVILLGTGVAGLLLFAGFVRRGVV